MGAYHSSYRPETATLRAIFIAPTKLKSFYIPPFIVVHSLSLASLDSSLREGAGVGLHHSSGCSLKSGVAGDFRRPYETQNVLHFTAHRGDSPA